MIGWMIAIAVMGGIGRDITKELARIANALEKRS